jgi:hypothetical protein
LPVEGGTDEAVAEGEAVAVGEFVAVGEAELEKADDDAEDEAAPDEGVAMTEGDAVPSMVVTLAGIPAVMIPPEPAVGSRTPPRVAVALPTGQSGRSETS